MCVCVCVVGARIERSGVQFYQTVIVNDSVQLACEATGLPRPSITWLKDDVTITHQGAAASSGSRLRSVDGGAKLEIARAKLIDSGTYECRAENYAGHDRLHYHLNVLGLSRPIVHTRFHPLMSTQWRGTQATTACTQWVRSTLTKSKG